MADITLMTDIQMGFTVSLHVPLIRKLLSTGDTCVLHELVQGYNYHGVQRRCQSYTRMAVKTRQTLLVLFVMD